MKNKIFYCTYFNPEKREALIQKVNKLYIDMVKYQNDSASSYKELIAKFDEDTEEYSETIFLGSIYENKFTANYSEFYDYKDIKSVIKFLSQKNVFIYDVEDNCYTVEEFAKIIGFDMKE